MTKQQPKRKAAPSGKQSIAVQPITKPGDPIRAKYPVIDDFLAYDWQHVPQRHAYGAYALSLFANLPDYLDVVADALTEGSDDKDIDLCLVDREAGQIYIAQCYMADEWDKSSAPSNKADDLLTGLSWLLRAKVADIPEALKKKAKEVQDAVQSKDEKIDTVHLLYIHNCRESDNVKSSLRTVASSAKTLIQNDAISVSASEIGLPRLQRLYESLTKAIVVDDEIVFDVAEYTNETGDGWKAIATTVSGVTLHDLWQRHGDDLFSANVRGFLDMLQRKTSINRGILETVQTDPSRFWAYNNGVTILTKRISTSKGKLTAQGVSVINGAQTTGVLGKAPRESAAKVRVPCRFIESSDPKLVEQVIDFNNTQNAIKSFDFRSNDPSQRRLAAQFKQYDITYLHRRQGASRLPQGAIQAEVVAPQLAAFHGHFQTAIRQRRTIFEDRSTYGKVFPSTITAEHVYMVQCLADAATQFKIELHEKVEQGTANRPEKVADNFFGHSTSKFFVAGVIGHLAEQILGQTIPDLFAWSVKAAHVKQDRLKMVQSWRVVIDGIVPLIAKEAGDDIYETVRSTTELDRIAKNVGFLIHSLKNQYDSIMSSVRDFTEAR
jgi:hypothetical protein